jgi:hypothetical protein
MYEKIAQELNNYFAPLNPYFCPVEAKTIEAYIRHGDEVYIDEEEAEFIDKEFAYFSTEVIKEIANSNKLTADEASFLYRIARKLKG